MTDGHVLLTIPRQHTIKPVTLGQILDAANLTAEEFRDLL